jgi:hypothetical protein
LENYIPTAIATLIEPFWLLMNRLFCLLQPIEQLQDCKAKAKDSIDLDYSSLPPQLVVVRALRSKHFVLAIVCIMALLANLLAVAFAGLFRQETIDMRHAAIFHPPFHMKFVEINGTIGPDAGSREIGSLQFSGAYRGGNGEEQFLVDSSNYTRGTPLPAWTDHRMLYMPIFPEGRGPMGTGVHVEADTQAFGAELECTELDLGNNFKVNLTSDGLLRMDIETASGSGRAQCTQTLPLSPGKDCEKGPSAGEIVFRPTSRNPNATIEEQEKCMDSVVLGWMRTTACQHAGGKPLHKENATFIHCRPTWKTGHATILVDSDGRLQQPVTDLVIDNNAGTYQVVGRMSSCDSEANYFVEYSKHSR